MEFLFLENDHDQFQVKPGLNGELNWSCQVNWRQHASADENTLKLASLLQALLPYSAHIWQKPRFPL